MKNLTNTILQFWFSDNVKEKWFAKDKDFDNSIKEKFLDDYNFVKKQSIDDLTKAKKVGQILARIIVLDQFPRNMFRNSPKAFQEDKKAVLLSRYIIQKNMDNNIMDDELAFIYMPLMHSENLEDQELSVQKFKEIGNASSTDYAVRHKEIIEKFGRFPHRNQALGRESSADEIEFLKQPESSF